jgi:transcriptional regulator with XRE-family HTH domain
MTGGRSLAAMAKDQIFFSGAAGRGIGRRAAVRGRAAMRREGGAPDRAAGGHTHEERRMKPEDCNNIADRLRYMLDDYWGGRLRQMARMTKVGRAPLKEYVDGTKLPPVDFINRVAAVDKAINKHWLLTGGGHPYDRTGNVPAPRAAVAPAPAPHVESGRRDRLKSALNGFFDGDIAELAARCGMSPTAISDLLGGDVEFTDDEVIRIAEGTGVMLEWLASGEGRMLPDEGGPAGHDALAARLAYVEAELANAAADVKALRDEARAARVAAQARADAVEIRWDRLAIRADGLAADHTRHDDLIRALIEVSQGILEWVGPAAAHLPPAGEAPLAGRVSAAEAAATRSDEALQLLTRRVDVLSRQVETMTVPGASVGQDDLPDEDSLADEETIPAEQWRKHPGMHRRYLTNLSSSHAMARKITYAYQTNGIPLPPGSKSKHPERAAFPVADMRRYARWMIRQAGLEHSMESWVAFWREDGGLDEAMRRHATQPKLRAVVS